VIFVIDCKCHGRGSRKGERALFLTGCMGELDSIPAPKRFPDRCKVSAGAASYIRHVSASGTDRFGTIVDVSSRNRPRYNRQHCGGAGRQLLGDRSSGNHCSGSLGLEQGIWEGKKKNRQGKSQKNNKGKIPKNKKKRDKKKRKSKHKTKGRAHGRGARCGERIGPWLNPLTNRIQARTTKPAG